jgi:hypothetical protein
MPSLSELGKREYKGGGAEVERKLGRSFMSIGFMAFVHLQKYLRGPENL